MTNAMRITVFLFVAGLLCTVPFMSSADKDYTLHGDREETCLERLLEGRISTRSYVKREISDEDLLRILWSAYGIKRTDAVTGASMTVPSAGACYPMRVYVADKKGLRLYVPSGHSLEDVFDEDIRHELSSASHGQGFIASAPAVIVIACDYSIITARYGDRGERYAHMEAGHIGQNVSLQAVSLGLASVMVGAFDDQSVRRVLRLEKAYEALYLIPIGYAA